MRKPVPVSRQAKAIIAARKQRDLDIVRMTKEGKSSNHIAMCFDITPQRVRQILMEKGANKRVRR